MSDSNSVSLSSSSSFSSTSTTNKQKRKRDIPIGYAPCTQCDELTRYYVTNSHTKYAHCGFLNQPYCLGCWTPKYASGPYVFGDSYSHSVYITEHPDPNEIGMHQVDFMNKKLWRETLSADILKYNKEHPYPDETLTDLTKPKRFSQRIQDKKKLKQVESSS